MSNQDENAQPQVSLAPLWMTEAARGLSPALIQQVNTELCQAFIEQPLNQIIVKQRFHGFSDEPQSKLIVAVEVQYADKTHSSVLKVGDTKIVRKDYDRWQQCAAEKRNSPERRTDLHRQKIPE